MEVRSQLPTVSNTNSLPSSLQKEAGINHADGRQGEEAGGGRQRRHLKVIPAPFPRSRKVGDETEIGRNLVSHLRLKHKVPQTRQKAVESH